MQCRAVQGSEVQGSAGQGRAGQGRAARGSAAWRVRQGKGAPCHAVQGRAGPDPVGEYAACTPTPADGGGMPSPSGGARAAARGSSAAMPVGRATAQITGGDCSTGVCAWQSEACGGSSPACLPRPSVPLVQSTLPSAQLGPLEANAAHGTLGLTWWTAEGLSAHPFP